MDAWEVPEAAMHTVHSSPRMLHELCGAVPDEEMSDAHHGLCIVTGSGSAGQARYEDRL